MKSSMKLWLSAVLMSAALSACVVPQTEEQLKSLFQQPLMLLLIMFFGAGGSALKQLVVARRQGTAVSVFDYFAKVETVIMVGAVIASWLALLYANQLNIAAALAFGYVSNDAADTGTKDGRSAAIAGTEPSTRPPETKVGLPALVTLLAGLLACAIMGWLQ